MFFVALGKYASIQNLYFERGTPKIALFNLNLSVKSRRHIIHEHSNISPVAL